MRPRTSMRSHCSCCSTSLASKCWWGTGEKCGHIQILYSGLHVACTDFVVMKLLSQSCTMSPHIFHKRICRRPFVFLLGRCERAVCGRALDCVCVWEVGAELPGKGVEVAPASTLFTRTHQHRAAQHLPYRSTDGTPISCTLLVQCLALPAWPQQRPFCHPVMRDVCPHHRHQHIYGFNYCTNTLDATGPRLMAEVGERFNRWGAQGLAQHLSTAAALIHWRGLTSWRCARV